MIRKIIKIDQDKCDGCGICVKACHEMAIGLVDGKAKLLRDDYCDGLGDCLPTCPTGAITFEEREAAEFDAKAVAARMQAAKQASTHEDAVAPLPCGCPGSNAKAINREHRPNAPIAQVSSVQAPTTPTVAATELNQWPVQIKLVPVTAPYFTDANLLIAADCSAYAYGNFHAEFMRNKIAIIGCPKLDAGDYSEKLTEILIRNSIKSVTVVRMEVPCCGGIEHASIEALKNCGKMIPWRVVTISTSGTILD